MPQKVRRSATAAIASVPTFVLGFAVVMLAVLGVLSAMALVRSASTTWQHTSADECPDGAPALNCMSELPGTTTGRLTTRDGGSSLKAVVYVDVPSAPSGTQLFNDEVVVRLSNHDADRLHLVGAGQNVIVEMLDGEATGITGPNDESTTVTGPPTGQMLWRFAVTFAIAGALVFVVSQLVRRREGLPMSLPAVGWAATVGLLVGGAAGALVGWAIMIAASDMLLLPSMVGGAVVVGLGAAARTHRAGKTALPPGAEPDPEFLVRNRPSEPTPPPIPGASDQADVPSDSGSGRPIRVRLRRGDTD